MSEEVAVPDDPSMVYKRECEDAKRSLADAENRVINAKKRCEQLGIVPKKPFDYFALVYGIFFKAAVTISLAYSLWMLVTILMK